MISMLEVAFNDVNEGISIETRCGADLFDVAQFKSNIHTTKRLVKQNACTTQSK